MEHWDPIGVGHDPRRRYEYDRSIGGLYTLLISGASVQAVARRLTQIEEEEMGFTAADGGRTLRAAEKLCTLDLSLGEGGPAGRAR